MDPALCVHRIELRNVGDFFSTPAHYVPFLENSALCDLESPDLLKQAFDRVVILGGGGLLNNLQWKRELLGLRSAQTRALIAWGIGLNSHFGSSHKSQETIKPNDFKLFGIRDYGSGLPVENWVPCSTCLHPYFDSIPAASEELVVFEHHEYPIVGFSDSGAPRLRNNEMNLTKVLNFLSSGEVVVTNSYHGAYWATLMGRRVVVVDPFSDKFNYFKHPPLITESSDARIKHTGLNQFSEALEECRAANIGFADRVEDLMRCQNPRRSFHQSLGLEILQKRYADFRKQAGAMKKSIYPRRVLVEARGIIEGFKLAVFLCSRPDLAETTLVLSDRLELFSGTGIHTVSRLPTWWKQLSHHGDRLRKSTVDFLKFHNFDDENIPPESKYFDHLLKRWGNRLALFIDKRMVVVSSDEYSPENTENINKGISYIKLDKNTLLVQIGGSESPKIAVDIDLRGRLSPSAKIFVLSRCIRFSGRGTNMALARSLGVPVAILLTNH